MDKTTSETELYPIDYVAETAKETKKMTSRYKKCDSCGKVKKIPDVPWEPEQYVCGPCLLKMVTEKK